METERKWGTIIATGTVGGWVGLLPSFIDKNWKVGRGPKRKEN